MKTKRLSKRHRGVLMEDLDSKLDILIEGQTGLANRVDKMDAGLGDLENKVDAGFAHFTKKFEEVDYKFEAVFEQLYLIRNEKISRGEFVALEKKVLMLEKKLANRK